MARDMKNQAIQLFNAGVKSADPALAVRQSLQKTALSAADGRLFVVAIGKAAGAMAKAAMEMLSPWQTLVITTPENAHPLPDAQVLTGSHPVPDASSVAAGQAVLKLLDSCGPKDRVLALISGGGSALMLAPSAGLTLADKASVNRLLLESGLDIMAMNLIRQQLSRLKGGGLLRTAFPTPVTALILSDVVGDDLRVVASGPTTAPIGNRAQAMASLKAAGIWTKLPEGVRTVLSVPDMPPIGALPMDNRLIGSNGQSVAAMGELAPDAKIFPHALEGDVQEAAITICRCKKSGTWLSGGETTVRLTGDGLGGRNQELALRVAVLAEKQNWSGDWVFLSGGTDGRDGPTDAAGGLVDGGTLARIRSAGLDPQKVLDNNDSYHGLKAAGDLLITGATGTNVADLQVLIRR